MERDRALRQIAIIGLGRFGTSLAQHLAERGHEVFGIDCEEDAVQRAKDLVTHAMQVELYDPALVRELGLDEVDVAVVAIGADAEASILTTAVLLEAGVRYVVARANSPLHGMILERVGAHRVVYPEAETGESLAHSLRAPGITAYVHLGPDIGIATLRAPEAWIGRSLADLYRAGQYPLVVLVIQRGDETLAEPAPEERIQAGDNLALLVQESKLDDLRLRGPLDR